MKILAAIILIAASAGCVALDGQPTATLIEKDIQNRGAKAVVDDLWNSDRYEYVMDKIGTGSLEWVNLSAQLATGTDAGASEELPIALAFALPRNPGAVLSVSTIDDGPLSVKQVCSAPFIEDTVKDIPAYLRSAKDAVRKVKSQTLTDKRAACLAELEKSK